LPKRELGCGLGECIKHGVIRDESLFAFVEENASAIVSVDADTMVELVRRNVEIKAAVVIEDERESGVRAHLNFGHTFAHAIERTVGFGKVLHGEAVGLGMIAAARTAEAFGLCDAALVDRIRALVVAVGLPAQADLVGHDELMGVMSLDKKVVDSRIRFVLPDRMGSVVVRDDVPDDCIRAGWDAIRAN
jgi:3-dehydroquinate synthase